MRAWPKRFPSGDTKAKKGWGVVRPQGTLSDRQNRIGFVVAFAAELVKRLALRQAQENSPARNLG
jgi:hypothetical protein